MCLIRTKIKEKYDTADSDSSESVLKIHSCPQLTPESVEKYPNCPKSMSKSVIKIPILSAINV